MKSAKRGRWLWAYWRSKGVKGDKGVTNYSTAVMAIVVITKRVWVLLCVSYILINYEFTWRTSWQPWKNASA